MCGIKIAAHSSSSSSAMHHNSYQVATLRMGKGVGGSVVCARQTLHKKNLWDAHTHTLAFPTSGWGRLGEGVGHAARRQFTSA